MILGNIKAFIHKYRKLLIILTYFAQKSNRLEVQMRKFVLIVLSFIYLGIVNAQPIVTDSTTRSTIDSNTTLKSPPSSAIIPAMNNTNSDLCTVGVAGAVQTQILGISAGSTIRDMNCERLKLSKTLYDMGMKIAAVSTLCQDKRVFDAMMMAGTPCPYDGMIGTEAKSLWKTNASKQPGAESKSGEMSNETKTLFGAGGVLTLLLLLLL
jgi:hypothetical protein